MCVSTHIQMDTFKNMHKRGGVLNPHFYISNPSMVMVTMRLKIEDGYKILLLLTKMVF